MVYYAGRLFFYFFFFKCFGGKPIKIFISFKKSVYFFILPNNFFFLSCLKCFFFWNFTFYFLEFFSLISKLISIKYGFLKSYKAGLFLFGLGFRFLQVGVSSLIFKLGYAHLVKFYIKFGIKVFKPTRRSTKIFFFSQNKNCLSSFVASVRLLRSPDNYKAKGFQIFGELIKVKKREKFGSF
ncbi:ribosomal protein L6 (mitochondrion) [Paulinella micropora]|uniref:Ribosomal protein L6 n=1 Tax=Paulinella micropora TaxID=1928728 RepID=A0A5K7W3J5_9EUKA|nr:ribosomal protein L6 [Paulinella micropora]BBL86710.1 ribosomal protein L6 [Paulinella micropora]